jgi:hypothetical protein
MKTGCPDHTDQNYWFKPRAHSTTFRVAHSATRAPILLALKTAMASTPAPYAGSALPQLSMWAFSMCLPNR